MSFGRSARHGEGWQLSFVEAAELERAVRSLMGGSEEGKKAREKAVEMKAACRNAVEEGGAGVACGIVATQRVVQDALDCRHKPHRDCRPPRRR